MKIIILALLAMIPVFSTASTSEENRAGKKFEATFQAALFDYRASTSQVSAMYFIEPNQLLGLKLGTRDGGEKQTNIALQYKRYLGNSFYMAPEIFYLNSREDVNGIFGDIFSSHDYANYSSMGAGFRIGNQWTWKHFTLGCDWVGIGQRLGTFRKDTSRLNDTTYTFLNVIIGASF